VAGEPDRQHDGQRHEARTPQLDERRAAEGVRGCQEQRQPESLRLGQAPADGRAVGRSSPGYQSAQARSRYSSVRSIDPSCAMEAALSSRWASGAL
jgi:hypothetical protein